MAGESGNMPLLKTLARNEELLAQVYLKQHPEGDTAALLTAYFQKRGWQISQQTLQQRGIQNRRQQPC